MLRVISALKTVRTQPKKRKSAVEQGILLKMKAGLFKISQRNFLMLKGPNLKRYSGVFS